MIQPRCQASRHQHTLTLPWMLFPPSVFFFRWIHRSSPKGRPTHQSLSVFSEQGQLLQTIPQPHVERMLHQQMPIARFESQRNGCQRAQSATIHFLCFWGRYDRLSDMFRRSASLAIPHHKSFAAILSLSLSSLDTRIAASNCHTHRSVKLPSFRHFQDRFLTTNKEKWGKKNVPVFRKVCVFDVSRAVGIARFESVSELHPHRTIQCH